MKLTRLDIKPICVALIAAGVLSACGGGGGGDSTTTTAPGTTTPGTTTPGTTTPGTTTPGTTTPGTTTPGTTTPGPTTPGTTTPGTTPPSGSTSTTMSCPDGANFQCSGSAVLAVNNGITLTNSGVQVYGTSTNDLANPIIVKTSASGFAPVPQGTALGLAEARVARDASGTVTSPVLVLSNFGLSWDGIKDRPPIIETFNRTQGRTSLTASGAVTSSTLPAPSDLTYYDFKFGTPSTGTQANYANNRYFPRSSPSRCAADVRPEDCRTTETDAPRFTAGNWRSGGTSPDTTNFVRLHEDGDIHAGNGPLDANGNPTILEGGNGIGVPFPGSKGYRSFDSMSLEYTNLGAWLTQDTVLIEEWAKLGNEHNKNRRGVITYGAVTDPSIVPTTGTASYSGIAYGYYAPNRTVDPSVFRGTATVTVNFATRLVTVTVQNAITDDSAGTSVPANFTTVTTMGAAGSNLTNYMNGAVSSGTLTGGLGGRYFGPLAGGAPIEIGGTFQMANASSGQTVIGGFMGRKQ